MRPVKTEEYQCATTGQTKTRVTEALFIFKFGGELTHAGLNQALACAEAFRKKMYVDGDSNAAQGGLLRLHSTYRHDLQCQASDEGRCLKTAAAFLKGLLAFEGALAPILASMVRNDDESKALLDDSSRAQSLLAAQHSQLSHLMHFDTELECRSLNEEFFRLYNEHPPNIIVKLFNIIVNPLKRMKRMAEIIDEIVEQ
jgi:inositol-hexakisphosphate/diphosphoinositol-pentakisphosphate 1-kinase